jgi:hypothetical protein
MRPDIIEVTRAEIIAAGISGVTGRMPAKAEAVVVSLAPSTTPRTLFDGSREADYALSVVVKRESERQAMDEAFAIADLLNDKPPYSANGSYALSSIDVGVPRSINWDEAGYYVWTTQATAHVTI